MRFLVVVFALGLLASGTTAQQLVKAPFSHFDEAPITTVTAKGWLGEFLNRQRTGLTGHPEVLSYPYDGPLWAGTIERVGEHGDNWWRYEQTAYYSDGLLRLGYLLNDTAFIQKARAGINYTLAHRQANNRLGSDQFSTQWPMAVYFRVLQAEYLATGDKRIVDALQAHYLTFTPEQLGKEPGKLKRSIMTLEGILWTYGVTKDEKLLKLAEDAWTLGDFALNQAKCLSADTIVMHGVTYMEMAKLPAILYSYTGKPEYLAAAVNAFAKLDRDHMLPDGVPSSNEFLAGRDPFKSHETCDITDYSWSAGYLLMATGDARYADRIEKAIFNAGPGAVSKDFRNLQYFSSVNQVIATGNSNTNKLAYGSTWMAYWPCHETECCAGNVHRMMPNYITRMWLRNKEGGPVAALYGPSVERLQLGNQNVTITETTDYPFSESISFTFDMASPATFPFTFRIPAWCTNAAVTINGKVYAATGKPGSFTTITRQFRKGDKIVLQLPMTARLIPWNKQALTVERGPLLYAYAVPEKVTIDTATYANLAGKKSHDPGFPALSLTPAGSWNYTLAATDSLALHVIKKATKGYPLDPGNAPVVIEVPARKLAGWQLVENRFTPPLPTPGQYEASAVTEKIILVPYGTTRLRVAAFPAEL
ncbi:MAG: glycoside hydrolase family 127 protein [Chitinophagaceae bacterium]